MSHLMSQDMSPDEEKRIDREVPLLDHSQLPFNSSVSSLGNPSFGDGSELLFSMYSAITAEEDEGMVERWQKNTDNIIIFAGLFSAAVAALLALSLPDLRPNPQDTANFYLQNINQLLVNQGQSHPSIPSAVAQLPPFSPPSYSIWANMFWILSLYINLLCAVAATILQEWIRQYVMYTRQRHCSPKTRARIRALFFSSVDKLFIQSAVSMLPGFVHIAGIFFVLGILTFLFNVNRIIFNVVLFFVVVTTVFHLLFTIISFFHHDSLLSLPLVRLPVSFLAFVVCFFLTMFGNRFNYEIWKAFGWVFKDVGSKAEKLASRQSSKIDVEVFEMILNSLSEDDAVDRFFRGIPRFFDSKLVDILPTALPARIKDKFKQVLNGFLDHTFHSNTVTEDIRCSRLIICLDASHTILGPHESSQILDNILDGKWPKLLRSVEIGHSLRSWGNSRDESSQPYIRSIVSRIIANLVTRNDRWMELVVDQLGISRDLLQEYISHGDSVLLASFINAAGRIVAPDTSVPPSHFKYNVSSALPVLQQGFCVLWNEIVQKAQNSNDRISILMLKNFHHIYIRLHEGTVAYPTDNHTLDETLSYPLCTVANHHSHPMPHQYSETTESVSCTSATHSRIQAIPYHGVSLGPGTRHFGTIDNPSTSPALLGSDPLPTPPSAIRTSKQEITVSAVSPTASSSPHYDTHSCVATGDTVVPSTANPDPCHHTPRAGTAGTYKDGNAKPAVPPSSVSTDVTPSDYLSHASGFLSEVKNPTTTGPHQPVDLKTHIPTKESRQPLQLASSTQDIPADGLGPGDHQDGLSSVNLL